MPTRIERVAGLALRLGGKYLAPYGAARSRHDFTQSQLMACLLLKHCLKTSYRGVADFLGGHSGLREVPGLERKLPHYTALQKFSARSEVAAELGVEALAAQEAQGEVTAVAVDSTGLEHTGASAHYVSRRGRVRRSYLKRSLSVVCGALLPLGAVASVGPDNDKVQAGELLEQSFTAAEAAGVLPQRLLADAGCDADWMHGVCREAWGVHSVIRPVVHRSDGKIGGCYRPQMTPRHLKRQGYGRRWHIESFLLRPQALHRQHPRRPLPPGPGHRSPPQAPRLLPPPLAACRNTDQLARRS